MPKLTLIASFYWLCLAQKVVSGDDLYRKVGGEMVLKPDKSTVPDSITSILWKHGKNKVAELDKAFGGLDIYAAFKDRTTLDQTTGELRITGLKKTDSGVYSVEFNGKLLDKTYELSVIKAVPKPTITSSCNTKKTSCTLTCEGDTTDAEPVTYSWKVGEGLWEVRDKQMNVSKSNTGKSTNSYKYICMLENSVSSEVSEPVGDLFGPEPSEVSWVVVGVVVVIILMLVANVIAGIWWVRKIKKEHPDDNIWEILSKVFCGMCAKASDGNNQTTVSDGVQPEQEVLLTDITKTNEDDADKAGKGQENGEHPDDNMREGFSQVFCAKCYPNLTLVPLPPAKGPQTSDGNNQTTAKGSDGVQPEQGGNDKTKTDGNFGPGGNETKMYSSDGPGGNDETKTDSSDGPGGDIKAAEKGEASGEESKLLNESPQ